MAIARGLRQGKHTAGKDGEKKKEEGTNM